MISSTTCVHVCVWNSITTCMPLFAMHAWTWAHLKHLCLCRDYVCVCVSLPPASLCAPFTFFVSSREESQRSIALHYAACYQVEKTRTESGQMGPVCRGREAIGGMSRDWGNSGRRARMTEETERERMECIRHGHMTGRERRGDRVTLVCWAKTRHTMTGLTQMKMERNVRKRREEKKNRWVTGAELRQLCG